MINASLMFSQLQDAFADLEVARSVVAQKEHYIAQVLEFLCEQIETGSYTAGSLKDYLVVVQHSASQEDLEILKGLALQTMEKRGEYILIVTAEKSSETSLIREQFTLGILTGEPLLFDIKTHALIFQTMGKITRAFGIDPSWATALSESKVWLPNRHFSELRRTPEGQKGNKLFHIAIGNEAVSSWFMNRNTSYQLLFDDLKALLAK